MLKCKLSIITLLILTISMVLFSCAVKDKSFREIRPGENFYQNVDGHYKKLPNEYALRVLLGEKTSLIKLPEHLLNVKLGSVDDIITLHQNGEILEAHYIKGYFNDSYLILCEETTENQYAYISFNFDTEEIAQYSDVETLYETFGFASSHWFTLCNTYEQME